MIFGILHGIILLDLINVYTALAVHLQFDKCYDEMNVNEYQNYEIKWTGKVIYTTCKMRFHGYNKYAVSNEYRVCIKATTWEISESEATLRYYSSKSNFKEELKMKFTRNGFYTPTTQWCSESTEIVDVELVTLPYGQGGLIQLEVWAVVTWDHKKMVSVICGAVAGVIIATTFIAVILYLRAIRKKRKQETTTDIFTITDYNNCEQIKDPDEMYKKRPFSHSSSTQSSESESIALKSEELHSGQSEPTSPPSYNYIVYSSNSFIHN